MRAVRERELQRLLRHLQFAKADVRQAPPASASSANVGALITLTSHSDSEEEDDPDRFAKEDFLNHQMFMNNPLYAEMMRSITKDSPINVRTDTAGGGNAGWGKDRRINLPSKQQGLARASAMLFESTNAFHNPRSESVPMWLGEWGDTDEAQENWAYEQESIEYDGIRKHHEIMSYGVKYLGWPEKLDKYRRLLEDKWATFEGYMQTQLKRDHTNLHRSNYRTIREQRIEKAKQLIEMPPDPLVDQDFFNDFEDDFNDDDLE